MKPKFAVPVHHDLGTIVACSWVPFFLFALFWPSFSYPCSYPSNCKGLPRIFRRSHFPRFPPSGVVTWWGSCKRWNLDQFVSGASWTYGLRTPQMKAKTTSSSFQRSKSSSDHFAKKRQRVYMLISVILVCLCVCVCVCVCLCVRVCVSR